jgi:hypothetical protein
MSKERKKIEILISEKNEEIEKTLHNRDEFP